VVIEGLGYCSPNKLKGMEMKIKQITSQSRRDFTAILECEHCGKEEILKNGYDDDNYHCYVIPAFVCSRCGKKASDEYIPKQTKYAAHEII
jgi:transposase-like protein